MFPIENLRQAVETAKRILTKEKLDKQLTGHTSISPFMIIRDGTERKVSFNARDELGDKIDKLTVMMSRLVAKDNNKKRAFKPQIYKSRGSYPQGQNRSYNQRGYQSRGRLGSRSDSRNRGQYGIIDLDSSKTIKRTIFLRTLEDIEDKIVEENIGIIGAMIIIEAGIDQEKGHSQGIMATIGIEGQVIVDQDQGSRASTNRDRIRCYNCRECDHFARDCPNSREERDLEQLQQMLNLGGQGTNSFVNQQTR